MDNDQDPVLSIILQRLSEIGGSSKHRQDEFISDSIDHDQAIEACSPEAESDAKSKTDGNGEEMGVEQEEEKRDFIYYLPLYKDVINGDWESTRRVFEQDPSAITAGLTSYEDTALHLAVRTGLPMKFINKLLGLMSDSDLETLDVDKDTALHCAGIVGYTEAAKVLVQRNPRLTQFQDFANKTPLHWAAQYAHKDTVWFLLSATRHEYPSPFAGESGAKLLNLLIIAEFYDIAIHVLKCYPSLATARDDEGFTPLHRLALKPRAFLSGSQLGILQRLLYKCISVEKVNITRGDDVENPGTSPEYRWQEPRKLHRKFGFLQHIYKARLMHLQSHELAKMLCAEIVKSRNLINDKLVATPIVTAARLGIYELVVEILKAFPDAIWCWDDKQRYIFHLAVLFRKERVYNLVYQMSLQRHYVMSYEDKFGNNILHLAGKLEPSNRIPGAALQMQRELQWFKEVEKVVQPSYKEMENHDWKTPREVFTDEHKELVIKGEEWMKNTASSCTVVAALVATVVFAAAFTLPGGNNSDGFPIFLDELPFLIFSVSNALALFASSTSVLMFLGILTSRYSEEDFLSALPMRLCIGLVTLFLSIAFMLAAFSASLHIVLVHRLDWVAAPIVLLACIPLTLFAFLQFPLLVEIVSSTFGPSIFHQQSKEFVY